eukprot:2916442-Rhodomonas_salina.1
MLLQPTTRLTAHGPLLKTPPPPLQPAGSSLRACYGKSGVYVCPMRCPVLTQRIFLRAMCGTDLVYAATRSGVSCYAPATRSPGVQQYDAHQHPPTLPALRSRVLSPYAMPGASGSPVARAGNSNNRYNSNGERKTNTSFQSTATPRQVSALPYCATRRLLAPQYCATRRLLSAYARAMQCPVLRVAPTGGNGPRKELRTSPARAGAGPVRCHKWTQHCYL